MSPWLALFESNTAPFRSTASSTDRSRLLTWTETTPVGGAGGLGAGVANN
jgi:hypothetical protein